MYSYKKLNGGDEIKKILTHLSLFSGIGGLDLAAEWAGFYTVGQCEIGDYATKVLEKHWPEVPRWREIQTLTGESFYACTGLRTVDVISGGFPCQPFSRAGKRRGEDDDRYLWPEMFRVIKELRPTWVIGENVAGIVDLALDQVLSDLESQGYKTRTFIIPAYAVEALHRRDRVAIVAYSDSTRRKEFGILLEKKRDTYTLHSSFTESSNVIKSPEGSTWWETEPGVGRVVNGIPSRVDRLKSLGNAVVPEQFYPIFKAISDIEC